MKLRSASKKEEKKPAPASEKKTNKSFAISKEKGADQANAAKKAASSKQTITTHSIIGKSAIEAPHARFSFPSDIDEEFGFGDPVAVLKQHPKRHAPNGHHVQSHLQDLNSQEDRPSHLLVQKYISKLGSTTTATLKNDFEPTPNPDRVDPFLVEFRPQMPIWYRPCNYIMLDPWVSPRTEFREIDDLLCRQFKPVWVDDGHVDYVEVTNKAYGWSEEECPEWYDVSYPLIFKGRHFSRADGYWSGTNPPQLPPGWSWSRTRGHY
ncbi:hypothetical protein B9Z65_7020 [Elsinoe australis]|uniref:Uncharacterized protein n=1 Tax=Elsinoe australis TaxID=40998 RepID=A0A2P7Z4C7_9PEZI|nr:hypothetical protein B9Z65_7020 [Elsinoe australis]